MEDFSLPPGWIEKKYISSKKFDSLKFVYDVKVPSDLYIIDFIKEVNKSFIGKNTKMVVEERDMRRLCDVKFFNGENLLLQVFFKKNDTFERSTANLAITADFSNGIENESLAEISKMHFPVNYLLLPEESAAEFTKQNKFADYLIIINDSGDDDRFRLSGIANRTKLLRSVKNLKLMFPGAAAFAVDENSGVYSGASYYFIKEEFRKNNMTIIGLSKLKKLNGESPEDLKSRFSFLCTQALQQGDELILISPDDLQLLNSQISEYRKKGVKTVKLEDYSLFTE